MRTRGSPLLGQVFPKARGHVLPVEAGIEALADASAVEVGLPKLLEEFFVLRHEVVAQET